MIANAWSKAERTVFTQLITALNLTENINAFLSFIPEDRFSISLSSGGNSQATSIERLFGANPLFCTLATASTITITSEKRDQCLEYASKIMSFLNDTHNMHETGNVQWFRLNNMPSSPTFIETPSGRLLWQVEIECELIYETETEYT